MCFPYGNLKRVAGAGTTGLPHMAAKRVPEVHGLNNRLTNILPRYVLCTTDARTSKTGFAGERGLNL